MKRLRVVHISRGYGDYVISLANQLAEFSDLYVVLTAADAWMAPLLEPRINIVQTNAPRVASIRNTGALHKLTRIVQSISPDIIHYQSGVIWESLLPRLRTRARVVTTVHDVVHHPHQLKFQFTPQSFIDRLAAQSDALIVHGECLKKIAQQRFFTAGNGNKKLLASIPHPIISRYGVERAGAGPGLNVLLFGGLAQWKGIEILLPAMLQLLDQLPQARLKISGPSSMPDYYRNLDPHHPQIEIDIRRQADTDVQRLFRWADVLALPYIEASQSGVLHIAQSFSLPVVASRVGALAESIESNVNGLLVPPGDIHALKEGLLTMLRDTSLRARTITAMTSHRDRELNECSVGHQTAEFYTRLLTSERAIGL